MCFRLLKQLFTVVFLSSHKQDTCFVGVPSELDPVSIDYQLSTAYVFFMCVTCGPPYNCPLLSTDLYLNTFNGSRQSCTPLWIAIAWQKVCSAIADNY